MSAVRTTSHAPRTCPRSRRTFRRLPFGYAAMSRRGIPDDLLHDWFGPARRDKDVRRDFAKFATGAPDRATLLSWFERMRRFDRPVLVVWAAQDTMMPAAHGPRLAALYPNSRLEVVEDSATLIPEDQPERLAALIRDFALAPHRHTGWGVRIGASRRDRATGRWCRVATLAGPPSRRLPPTRG